MELVLPTYNAHLYFPLKNLGKKCTLYMAKYDNSIFVEASFFQLYKILKIFNILLIECLIIYIYK